MNLRRVELTVYTDNAPALALYRKFGFETEGEMRDYAVRDGRFVDVYSMARLRRVEGGWGVRMAGRLPPASSGQFARQMNPSPTFTRKFVDSRMCA